MKVLREDHHLDEDDTSKDAEILKLYSPGETFDLMLSYEGIMGYSSTIKRWIKDIYHTSL